MAFLYRDSINRDRFVIEASQKILANQILACLLRESNNPGEKADIKIEAKMAVEFANELFDALKDKGHIE